MPDLVLGAVRESDPLRGGGLDSSLLLASTAPPIEPPSRGRFEGNVSEGGEPRLFRIPVEVEGQEATLFENRASLKLLTSQVAMHLSFEERRNLFEEIDRLLGVDHWEDDSSLIDAEAFRSFLRFTIYARPVRAPNVGISDKGTLLTGWHAEKKSVHVEFLPSDQCIALIGLISSRGPERMAWRGHVARLRDVILANGAHDCLGW